MRKSLFLLLVLLSGEATAHGGEDHNHDEDAAPLNIVAATNSPQRLADGSLFIPKPVQRKLGLRTQIAQTTALASSFVLNGKVIADPNASGRVQAIQPGRIEAGPKGLPMLGQQVAKGEVLAWLRPVASSQERGDQQALLADLDAQTAIAERRVRRLDQLEGALPQKDIEAARLELVALQQRRAAIGARLAGAEPLRAPVSGVISTAHAVAGQVVDAREVVFEVINPSRLMVEAQSFETAPTGHLSQASAQFAGGSVPLRYLGAAPQLNQQAMTLLFRVERPSTAIANHPLSVGQPVSVIATTAQRSDGVAVPLGALVKNAAGENVVWLHTGAERFEARSVKWSVLDGERVAVSSGLRDGDRIVIQGASLLAQMR